MKQILFLFLFSMLQICFLFSEENNNMKIYPSYNSEYFSIIKFSPCLLIGGSVGYGKKSNIKEKNIEYIINLYYNQGQIIEKIKTGGLYFQYNVYTGKKTGGLYTILNLGIGYAVINKQKERFVPNLSFGLGYNLSINEKSFLRFEIDGGIKLYIASLNFAIIL